MTYLILGAEVKIKTTKLLGRVVGTAVVIGPDREIQNLLVISLSGAGYYDSEHDTYISRVLAHEDDIEEMHD